MTTKLFKNMCDCLTEIAHYDEPIRNDTLKVFMSQVYLFLELTNKQVEKLKALFKAEYPDKFIEYGEPDEHAFTAAFEYLRFK